MLDARILQSGRKCYEWFRYIDTQAIEVGMIYLHSCAINKFDTTGCHKIENRQTFKDAGRGCCWT